PCLTLDPPAPFPARLAAKERPSVLHRGGIAHPADPGREIARRKRAGVEVLMELTVRWRKYDAVLPIEPLEILLAFIPQERVAMAGDAHHVEARPVAVALLVGADRHFRDVRVHR